MLKKAVLIIFFIIATANLSLFAQNPGYKTGIGLRGGYESGLTLKHFIASDKALEGIYSRHWGNFGTRITVLYEIQKPISGAKGLSFFYGVGGHIGFYNGLYYGYKNNGYYDKNGNWQSVPYQDRYTSIGIDGILGLEYKFSEIPFTVGLDIKPFVDLTRYSNYFGDAAFSVRYTF